MSSSAAAPPLLPPRHIHESWVVVGARFQVYSADSSRLLSDTTYPPSSNIVPDAHQVDWAQGYTTAPHPTNEWMGPSIPHDLGFARLSLTFAPATHLPCDLLVLQGGVTAVQGHPDRVWKWGSSSGGHSSPAFAHFYTRVRPMHPQDPTCLLDYESGEPTQVFPHATVSLSLHWAPHSTCALNVTCVSRFATPLWRAPAAAPPSLCQQLMALPDIETWQDADGCHGLADFSLSVLVPPSFGSPNVLCQWSESMAVLVRQALTLPPSSPSSASRKRLCHAATTAQDWQTWTRATHSFGSNLAQFHPDNALLVPSSPTRALASPSDVCPCSAKLTVTPSPSASAAKPYLAAELRCPYPLTTHPRDSQQQLIYHTQTTLLAASAPGLVSAAFLYSDPTQEEIDVVEVTGNRPREPQMNWFAQGAKQPPARGGAGGGWPRRMVPGWNATSDAHVYALAWWPGVAIVWVVDGRPVARVVGEVARGKEKKVGGVRGAVGKLVQGVLHHHQHHHAMAPPGPQSRGAEGVPPEARPPAGFPIPNASTVLMLNTWPSASGHDWAGVLDKRAIREGRPGVSAEYADVHVWVEPVAM